MLFDGVDAIVIFLIRNVRVKNKKKVGDKINNFSWKHLMKYSLEMNKKYFIYSWNLVAYISLNFIFEFKNRNNLVFVVVVF